MHTTKKKVGCEKCSKYAECALKKWLEKLYLHEVQKVRQKHTRKKVGWEKCSKYAECALKNMIWKTSYAKCIQEKSGLIKELKVVPKVRWMHTFKNGRQVIRIKRMIYSKCARCTVKKRWVKNVNRIALNAWKTLLTQNTHPLAMSWVDLHAIAVWIF